jgi:branched-chain amino acid transport system ATP-binding protein
MTRTVLEVRNLNKRFGAVVAADDISIAMAAGEVIGIIGANGAGKTTFVNMVTGHLKPDAGQVLFAGNDITALTPRAMTRRGITRSFQVAQLFPQLSARDNMLIALASAETERPASLADLRTPRRIDSAYQLLQRFGLADVADRLTVELPQGKRKLLDIALAMVGQTHVLLLDEPTSGISAEEKFPLMDLVMEVVGGGDATILFVEHDMEMIERYASRVIAFYEGRIIADGTPGAVLADSAVRRHVVGTEIHRRHEGRRR